MPTTLTPERAQAAARTLSRWLTIVLVFVVLTWGYASLEIGALASVDDVAEVLADNVSPGARVVWLGAVFVIGLGWTWALGNAAWTLWGGVGGVLSTAAVFALQRVFSFTSLIFGLYLLYRLRKVAPPSTEAPLSVERAATRAASAFAGVAAMLFFVLPVAAFFATVIVVWRQDATEDWHWLAKLPLSVALGIVMSWITSLVSTGTVAALAKR
jgi:hypothetical protein